MNSRALKGSNQNLTMLSYEQAATPSKNYQPPTAGHIPGLTLTAEQRKIAKAKNQYGARSHHATIFRSREERAQAGKERAAKRQETRVLRVFACLEKATHADARRILGLRSESAARQAFLSWEEYGLAERAGTEKGRTLWRRKSNDGS